MPLSPTLEVALQQDLGANAHLELCAWISSLTCRDKLKCHTEPTAALWWLLGRTMWVGTGHRHTYIQARRRYTQSSHSALLNGAVPVWDVWRLPWGMAASCSNTSRPLPQLWCVASAMHRIVSLTRQRCCSSKKTTVVKKKILVLK